MQGIKYLKIQGKELIELLEVIRDIGAENAIFDIFVTGHDERGRQFHLLERYKICKQGEERWFCAIQT